MFCSPEEWTRRRTARLRRRKAPFRWATDVICVYYLIHVYLSHVFYPDSHASAGQLPDEVARGHLQEAGAERPSELLRLRPRLRPLRGNLLLAAAHGRRAVESAAGIN